MKKIAHLLIVMMAFSLTSACGWRLRGSDQQIDVQQLIYLESASGKVYDEIKKSLTKKQRIADLADADIQLVLGDEFYERRSASVNNQAQTVQYQLTMSVPYEILNTSDEPLAEKSRAELSRYYTYNQNAINSSDKEEQALRKEMVRQLAQQILRRVIFVSKKQTASPQ